MMQEQFVCEYNDWRHLQKAALAKGWDGTSESALDYVRDSEIATRRIKVRTFPQAVFMAKKTVARDTWKETRIYKQISSDGETWEDVCVWYVDKDSDNLDVNDPADFIE